MRERLGVCENFAELAGKSIGKVQIPIGGDAIDFYCCVVGAIFVAFVQLPEFLVVDI